MCLPCVLQKNAVSLQHTCTSGQSSVHGWRGSQAAWRLSGSECSKDTSKSDAGNASMRGEIAFLKRLFGRVTLARLFTDKRTVNAEAYRPRWTSSHGTGAFWYRVSVSIPKEFQENNDRSLIDSRDVRLMYSPVLKDCCGNCRTFKRFYSDLDLLMRFRVEFWIKVALLLYKINCLVCLELWVVVC